MKWQLFPSASITDKFLNLVKTYTGLANGYYLAQLLWQRNIRTEEKLKYFLNYQDYQASSYAEFGEEIFLAKNRLEKALINQEKIAIWGDFDADGVTATSILWEGLGYFFQQEKYLLYYIPNRLTESHGLNKEGINKLVIQGVTLIITCDTGSTNIDEINYAVELGIDIIVTDHHTLPEKRPHVVAIINPRYLDNTHPLYHLSGVAVAYKLIECLADNWQKYKQYNPEELLDLVAIGLIADLVELKDDCRYLAQIGIKKLEKTKRYGLKRLLTICKTNGDRPTDISYGIGPRINAISRIHGDANFCIDLLTSKNEKNCNKLAFKAELANSRRKSLQEDIIKDAKKHLKKIDLSTTSVIVLASNQWELGVLGLVAGKIAEEYGRPAILLSIIETKNNLQIARGSARSTNKIDLYNLVASQSDLLLSFGGHPYAAGLSLLAENIEIFKNNINQKLRQQNLNFEPSIKIDMIVTVKDLAENVLDEINYLEPFGMGNKAPVFLVRNCWLENCYSQQISDLSQQKQGYYKTTFILRDDSSEKYISGIWWGHRKEELPENNRLDLLINIGDFNNEPQVTLIDIRIFLDNLELVFQESEPNLILDYRAKEFKQDTSEIMVITKPPLNWQQLEKYYQLAKQSKKRLALNYNSEQQLNPLEIWEELLTIAQNLVNNHQIINQQELLNNLKLSEDSLKLGLISLEKNGLLAKLEDNKLKFITIEPDTSQFEATLNKFLDIVEEEQFKKDYFTKVKLETIQEMLVK